MVFLHLRKYANNFEISAKGGHTICIPDYLFFPQGHSVFNSLGKKELLIGSVRCSDSDLYNRKIGRVLAEKNVKSTNVEIVSIKKYKDCFVYEFYIENLPNTLLVSVNENGKVIRFTGQSLIF